MENPPNRRARKEVNNMAERLLHQIGIDIRRSVAAKQSTLSEHNALRQNGRGQEAQALLQKIGLAIEIADSAEDVLPSLLQEGVITLSEQPQQP